MTTHFYTSFSYSYLNRARVLAESTKRHHHDCIFWAIITDKMPDGVELDLSNDGFDHIVFAEDLYGDATDQWLFNHDIVEACTAVKGRALLRIMDEPGCTSIIYLDPDIAVFHPLDTVMSELDTHSIVLTPHQLDPDNEMRAIFDNEVTSLDYGVFNLGFLAVRNDAEARRFAEWWAARLDTLCYDRIDQGIFVDQKWCNLIPCFFERVKVLRDPGCNVASWNLSQRTISQDHEGVIRVNGAALKFFHFTKLGPIGDIMTQRYAGDNIEVYSIWSWYRKRVEFHSDASIPKGWWYYGTWNHGEKIPKVAREVYRERPDLQAAYPSPREAEGDSFFSWYQRNMPAV